MIYHYYGDVVRRLFLLSALLMTITLPFFAAEIPGPFELSIFVIPLLVLAAGLTSPSQTWSHFLNTFLAVAGSIVFEYYAVLSYQASDQKYFAVNQILTVLFLFATYFSVKTVRGRRHEAELADAD
jgi:hypothetical protein